ncbi:hypothetical protein [Lysinibacillus sphaericus]|uniref:hypothetical protein n=1 Tax=Lysinibacillus sphaericus TaxID=1421 RepID=UPI003D7F8C24
MNNKLKYVLVTEVATGNKQRFEAHEIRYGANIQIIKDGQVIFTFDSKLYRVEYAGLAPQGNPNSRELTEKEFYEVMVYNFKTIGGIPEFGDLGSQLHKSTEGIVTDYQNGTVDTYEEIYQKNLKGKQQYVYKYMDMLLEFVQSDLWAKALQEKADKQIPYWSDTDPL